MNDTISYCIENDMLEEAMIELEKLPDEEMTAYVTGLLNDHPNIKLFSVLDYLLCKDCGDDCGALLSGGCGTCGTMACCCLCVYINFGGNVENCCNCCYDGCDCCC